MLLRWVPQEILARRGLPTPTSRGVQPNTVRASHQGRLVLGWGIALGEAANMGKRTRSTSHILVLNWKYVWPSRLTLADCV